MGNVIPRHEGAPPKTRKTKQQQAGPEPERTTHAPTNPGPPPRPPHTQPPPRAPPPATPSPSRAQRHAEASAYNPSPSVQLSRSLWTGLPGHQLASPVRRGRASPDMQSVRKLRPRLQDPLCMSKQTKHITNQQFKHLQAHICRHSFSACHGTSTPRALPPSLLSADAGFLCHRDVPG